MNESELRRSVYARAVGFGVCNRPARKVGDPAEGAPSKAEVRCCQSCGMSLRRDPRGMSGGGERKSKYCSYCFRDGKFTAPALTVTEMQALVKANLRPMGIPEQYAEVFLRRIPRLARWVELAARSAQASGRSDREDARDDGLLIAEAEA